MASFIMIYGSEEGQTQRISEHIAAIGRREGHAVTLMDGRSVPPSLDLQPYDAAIVGASIHGGAYPAYILDLVKRQIPFLSHTPSAFFTVCLTAADANAEHTAKARQYVDDFKHTTSWEPAKVAIFAGAIRYSEYGVLKRWMMKTIARQSGFDTAASGDVEYTDWAAVTRFAHEYFQAVDWAVAPFVA
jgi:menaquinone-dependent protoporphyrinogen oxidase